MNATATLPTMRDLGTARDILDEFLLETDGEETKEISALWEQLEGQIDQKAERWALWIVDRAGDAKKLKEEEQRLAARRKTIENAVERSKAQLLYQLQRVGKTKVNGLLVTIGVQNNPPAVKCAVEPLAVFEGPQGDLFATRTEHVDYALNREAVLAAWKTNQPLPEGITVEVGQHVRIR